MEKREGMVVIAAGGKLPCTVDSIRFMKRSGFVIYLSKLLTKREQFYSMADLSIENPHGASPRETAGKIAGILKRRTV
jgi:shikimate kinase